MPKHHETHLKPAILVEVAEDLDRSASSAGQQPSNRRRDLIKAAISVGPLIATLPGGEALANASALQCVVKEQDGTKAPPSGVGVPLADNYLRVAGQTQLYRSFVRVEDGGAGQGNILVYRYELDGETILVVGDNPTNSSAAPPGTWFDLTVSPPPFPIGSPTPASFLLLYDANNAPITDKSDVAVDASTGMPTGCNMTAPIWPGPPTSPTGPQSPQHCVYPMAVQVAQDTPGNIPLTQSCLTSFQ
ncbi:MAG TPA: hypothetical protein DDY14_14130 [Chromatiaceae bacterium]|nr:hypothetical protein [Chromatiaceae bacterium]